ncbi:MAG: hypothetical protein ACREPE_14775, partial [Lysobacter sp.]
YEHRISLSEGTVTASRMGVAGLRQSLLTLLKRASEAELSNKPVASRLAVDIRQQHTELVRHQSMLAQQQREAGLIESEFADTLARYRKLKSPVAPAPASTNGG